MSTRKWLFIADCGVSAAILAAILWRLDWPVFAAELRRLRFAWLAAAGAFIMVGLALRSLRWNLVVGRAAYRLSLVLERRHDRAHD